MRFFPHESAFSTAPREFPIIIYNIPQFSGTNISVAAVKQLASHPYIVGIKESGPIMAAINYARATVDQKDFAVLAGSGSLLLSGLMGGVDGAIIGAILPPSFQV